MTRHSTHVRCNIIQTIAFNNATFCFVFQLANNKYPKDSIKTQINRKINKRTRRMVLVNNSRRAERFIHCRFVDVVALAHSDGAQCFEFILGLALQLFDDVVQILVPIDANVIGVLVELEA